MSWKRLVHRNDLIGDYKYSGNFDAKAAISGDMRRVEKDQRDEYFLACYAEYAGITVEQVKQVLDAFFDGFPVGLKLQADEDRYNGKFPNVGG